MTPTGQVSLVIYPDQVKINGAVVTAMAHTPTKQKVVVNWRLSTTEQKDQLKATTHPIVVRGTAQVSPVSRATNAYQFDYARYLLGQNITTQFKVTHATWQAATELNLGQRIFAALSSWRKRVMLYCEHLPQPLRGLALLLVVGAQDLEFTEVITQIKTLGLIFLFCLSGLHVFYLTAGVRKIATLFYVTTPTINWLLLVLLPMYWVIGGQSVSLTRAVMMVWLRLFATQVNWRLSGVAAWSIVAGGNVLLAPYVIFNLGAQLSYLLTLALIIAPKSNQLLQGLWLNALSLLVIAAHTYTINWLTLLITPLFIFGFTWWILPLVGIGVVASLFSSPIMLWCNAGLALVLAPIKVMATWNTQIVVGAILPVIVWGCLLALLLMMVHPRRTLRYACIVVMGLAFNWWWLHQPQQSQVVFFDIGQGDATLIIDHTHHHVTLIDTGGKLQFTQQKWQERVQKTDAGQSIIVNYLKARGLQRIDHLILTHQDTDHTGYLPSVAQNIKVGKVYLPAGMERNQQFVARLAAANLKLAQVTPLTAATATTTALPRQLTILHPFTAGSGKNEDSIVVLVHFNQRKILVTGDLDQSGELLVMKQANVAADILKVGHHGSKTSTHPEFVVAVKPQLAVISAGVNNRYGHPHEQTMATLRTYQVPALTTAQVGQIILDAAGQVHYYVKQTN